MMLRHVPNRAGWPTFLMKATGAVCLLASVAHGQGLPATAPTAGSAVSAPSPAMGQVQVTCEQGKLRVVANGSSLNEILREAASRCAFTVHGGVQEERVFGTYGPAPEGDVLSVLLEGTGVNMVLRQSSNRADSELLLTARSGGPQYSPSSAPAQSFYQPPPQQVPSNPAPQPVAAAPPPPPAVVQSDPSQPTPAAQVDPTTPTAPATTDPAASNGVKTPQEIFDQLMKMQHQTQTTPPQ